MVAFLLAVALALAPGSLPAPRADTSPATADEATVRALVARWLDAQNKGDFPAYRALYAPSFHGVRRSGGRTVVLDHEGWLRDRERMFKKRMKVSAADVRVAPAGKLARATFVQEFSSGTYGDRGRKMIDVALIGGVPAIAREELLESERLASRDEADCPTAKALPFTGTFRGEPGWFVLGETSADALAIAARALKLEAEGVEAHPIATTDFQGLKEGLYAIVHGAFATRAEAQALVETLRQRKIQAFAKESGPLRGSRLVEIRGVAARNGKPGKWPLFVSTDDGGEGGLTSAPNGQFVMWMGVTGKLRIENLAESPSGHDMRATGAVCINLPPSTRGRVDAGTLDTTTWFCGQ
jgi:ketosteroid isomerase-like protein